MVFNTTFNYISVILYCGSEKNAFLIKNYKKKENCKKNCKCNIFWYITWILVNF
jgi:hypothetical protein